MSIKLLSPPPPLRCCFLFFAPSCVFLRLPFSVRQSLECLGGFLRQRALHKPVGVIQDKLFELTHTTNRLLTGFGSVEELVNSVPVARGLTRPCFSVPFKAVGNHQQQLVSVLCSLGNKSALEPVV
jgi:hypothetical protein